MNDNGHKEEEKVKYCPLIDKWCIKERCALYSEMMRSTGGLQQKFGLCSFNATVMLLSEMNMKAQLPQQKIQIPNLLRG